MYVPVVAFSGGDVVATSVVAKSAPSCRRRFLPLISVTLPPICRLFGKCRSPKDSNAWLFPSLPSLPLHKSTWLTFDLYAFCFIFRVKKVNGSAEKRFPRDTERARRGRMKYNHLQHLRLNTCTAAGRGRDGVRHELWSTRRHCRGK